MSPFNLRICARQLLGTLSIILGLIMVPLLSHAEEAPKLKIATSQGDIMVEVYPDKAPKTVANFLQYVKDKHYNGTIFTALSLVS